MENKKKYCSFIDHQKIEANSFCIICKVYMCNKCELFHSKLCQHHKVLNYNDENIKEFDIEFCKEEKHQSELEYYCRNHKILVCAKCITKIHDKNNGKHSDCDVCNINDIKNEKMNNLKNNINILQNLSSTLEETINNLKQIYEKISGEKEEFKLKVQKGFTKIRNELNNREDQILSDIDTYFDKKYVSEEIMNNSEKLPNKIKILLEKGKTFTNTKNNDLNMIINNCLLIENSIKDINTINNIIEKSYAFNNDKINILPNFEEDINQLLSIIKSSGQILDKYVFKFISKLNSNYQVSENGLIATKNGRNDWDCVIMGDREIPNNKISKWKIKLKYICDYKINSWSILVGIGPKNDGSYNFHHNCWSFICGECKINNKNKISQSTMNKARLKSGSIIEVIVDRIKGFLSFIVNGNDCGIVCKEIPKDEILYPFISIYDTDQIVEIIE